MLKIEANSHEIDLGTLKGLNLKYNPGIFEMESFEGSYGIPFTIPANERNMLIFGFVNKLNSKERAIVKLPGKIWHSGLVIKQGVIKASKFGTTQIICNFYVDNGEIFNEVNKKTLQENNYGTAKAFELKPQWDPNVDDYVLYTVKNPDYFKNTIFEGVTDDIAIHQNLFGNNTSLIYSDSSPCAVTPFPLLFRVLDYLFTNLGFEYNDEFFTSASLKTINIFHTNNIMEISFVDVLGNITSRTYLPDTINLANLLPPINTGDFIKSIQAFFNVVFYAQNNLVKVVDRKQIIISTDYVDYSEKFVGTFQKTVFETDFDGVAINILREQNDSNVSDLPDVSENENITETEIFPQSITEADPNQTVLYKTEYSSFSEYYKYINWKDIIPEETESWFWYRYHWSYTADIKAREYGKQMGILLGARGFSIDTNLSTLPETFFDEAQNAYSNYLPKVKQVGNSQHHTLKTDFGLRLMQYRGRQSVEDLSRPHGSNTKDDMSVSAFWSYYSRWKDFIEWYAESSKEEYEMQFMLNAYEIKNFDFSKKIIVNGNIFFVKTMNVTLTRTEIKPVQCTLIKAI